MPLSNLDADEALASMKQALEVMPYREAGELIDSRYVEFKECWKVAEFAITYWFFKRKNRDKGVYLAEESFQLFNSAQSLNLLCRVLTLDEQFNRVIQITGKTFQCTGLAGDAYLNHASALLRLGHSFELAASFYSRGSALGPCDRADKVPSSLAVSPSAFSYFGEMPTDMMGHNYALAPTQLVFDYVFLASGNEPYVRSFLDIYAESFFLSAAGENVALHIHLFDCSDEVVKEFEGRVYKNGFDRLFFSNEITGVKTNGYYYAGRFVQLPKMLEHYNCPIFVTDIDCIYTQNIRKLLEKVDNVDFAYVRAMEYTHPWAHFRANMALFSNSVSGKKIAKCISNFLGQLPPDDLTYWYVDQLALAIAYYTNAERRIGSSKEITQEYKDVCFQPTGSSGNPEFKASRAREEALRRGVMLEL